MKTAICRRAINVTFLVGNVVIAQHNAGLGNIGWVAFQSALATIFAVFIIVDI